MQPLSFNGHPNSTRETLDAVRHLVEKLEADLQKQQEEVKQLRAERDEYRGIVCERLKKKFDPNVWENFNPDEYTATIDDILADFNDK